MAASNSDSDFESPKVVSSSKKSVVGNLSSTRKKQLARKKTKLPPRIAKTPLNVDDSSYSLDSEFMILEKKRFPCKIQTYNQIDVIDDLKKTFSKKQKKLFLSTVFGHFISMPNVFFQAQLVHHVLLREVFSDAEDEEFWFNIKGSLVRYSIEEFCLITGLKCEGDDDTSPFLIKKKRFKRCHFPHD